MALFTSLIAPALDSVSKVISEFHLSPDEKAKADQAIQDAREKAEKDANDYDIQLNSIAGQNIRAEAQSGDKFTERARPSIIWMGNGLILWNYAAVPVLGAWMKIAPVNLPDAFWWTWATICTGYVFQRGIEKISALPGDSQITLPFGLGKIGNKS